MPESLGMNTEVFSHDKLFAGSNILPVSEGVVISSGQNLVRGSVMGRVTADSKWKLSASAAGDGSETPRGILADAINAAVPAGQVVTFTNGTDIVNLVAHGFEDGDEIEFSNDGGALPVEITAGVSYFVVNKNDDDFQIEESVGGGALDFTDDGTGTSSVHATGSVNGVVYLSGEYNQDALTLGAGHTVASIKDGLRDLNIYLKDTVAEDGT